MFSLLYCIVIKRPTLIHILLDHMSVIKVSIYLYAYTFNCIVFFIFVETGHQLDWPYEPAGYPRTEVSIQMIYDIICRSLAGWSTLTCGVCLVCL